MFDCLDKNLISYIGGQRQRLGWFQSCAPQSHKSRRDRCRFYTDETAKGPRSSSRIGRAPPKAKTSAGSAPKRLTSLALRHEAHLALTKAKRVAVTYTL